MLSPKHRRGVWGVRLLGCCRCAFGISGCRARLFHCLLHLIFGIWFTFFLITAGGIGIGFGICHSFLLMVSGIWYMESFSFSITTEASFEVVGTLFIGSAPGLWVPVAVPLLVALEAAVRAWSAINCFRCLACVILSGGPQCQYIFLRGFPAKQISANLP